jgi:hypothetical protein
VEEHVTYPRHNWLSIAPRTENSISGARGFLIIPLPHHAPLDDEKLRRLLDVPFKEEAVRRDTATMRELLGAADHLPLRCRKTIVDGWRIWAERQS